MEGTPVTQALRRCGTVSVPYHHGFAQASLTWLCCQACTFYAGTLSVSTWMAASKRKRARESNTLLTTVLIIRTAGLRDQCSCWGPDLVWRCLEHGGLGFYGSEVCFRETCEESHGTASSSDCSRGLWMCQAVHVGRGVRCSCKGNFSAWNLCDAAQRAWRCCLTTCTCTASKQLRPEHGTALHIPLRAGACRGYATGSVLQQRPALRQLQSGKTGQVRRQAVTTETLSRERAAHVTGRVRTATGTLRAPYEPLADSMTVQLA